MLQSQDRASLKNASIGLGIIAAVEVPEGHWEAFLQTMADNSTSDTYEYRLASVQTMGMMVEFLDEYIGKQLRNEQIGQVLHSTICNLDPTSKDLALIAIKALQRTIPSTGANFQNKDQRDFIMDGLFRAMAIDDEEEIQTCALQALSEVPAIGYETLAEYVPRIGEITVRFMQGKEATYSQARAILYFWQQLCEQELQKQSEGTSINIIAQYKDSLLPIIFDGLNITELDDEEPDIEESQDEMSWTVSRAAASLLVEVAKLLGDQILDETIAFAGQKLNSQSWQDHHVGMMALSSVMEGPTQHALVASLTPAYATIF